MTKSTLYYLHDPMCSWCWGFSGTLDTLLMNLPGSVLVQRVLGGLAADTDVPMSSELQQQIQSSWRRIENTVPGIKFNFTFWDKNIPRRSTYPACRAVIAARKQGQEYDVAMTKIIQTAYYQQARNPSDDATLIELADELKLSVADFKRDLNSDETNSILNNELILTQELFVESFPSLVLKTDQGLHTIELNYTDSKAMLDEVNAIINQSR